MKINDSDEISNLPTKLPKFLDSSSRERTSLSKLNLKQPFLPISFQKEDAKN